MPQLLALLPGTEMRGDFTTLGTYKNSVSLKCRTHLN